MSSPHLCGASTTWLSWASPSLGPSPSRTWPDRSSHPPCALRRRPSRRPRYRCPGDVFAHATGTPPFGLLSGTSGRSPSGFVTLYSRVSKNREIGWPLSRLPAPPRFSSSSLPGSRLSGVPEGCRTDRPIPISKSTCNSRIRPNRGQWPRAEPFFSACGYGWLVASGRGAPPDSTSSLQGVPRGAPTTSRRVSARDRREYRGRRIGHAGTRPRTRAGAAKGPGSPFRAGSGRSRRIQADPGR
jgi:hypothetical protein